MDNKKVSAKKEKRKEVVSTLEIALQDLKEEFSEKKFKKNIKKASKIIVSGMSKHKPDVTSISISVLPVIEEIEVVEKLKPAKMKSEKVLKSKTKASKDSNSNAV